MAQLVFFCFVSFRFSFFSAFFVFSVNLYHFFILFISDFIGTLFVFFRLLVLDRSNTSPASPRLLLDDFLFFIIGRTLNGFAGIYKLKDAYFFISRTLFYRLPADTVSVGVYYTISFACLRDRRCGFLQILNNDSFSQRVVLRQFYCHFLDLNKLREGYFNIRVEYLEYVPDQLPLLKNCQVLFFLGACLSHREAV